MKHFLTALALLAAMPVLATRTVLSGAVTTRNTTGELALYYYASVLDKIDGLQTRATAKLTGGRYQFILDLERPVNVFLKDGEAWLTYSNYLAPGDSLVLSFSDSSQGFEGNCEDCNALVFLHDERYFKEPGARAQRQAAQTGSFSAYISYATSLREGSLRMLDTFFKSGPAPAAFLTYYRAEQNYSYASDLLQRSWRDARLMRDTAYQGYLHMVPFNDPGALINDEYVNFLRELPYSSFRALWKNSEKDSDLHVRIGHDQYRIRDSVARSVFSGEVYNVARYQIFKDRLRELELQGASGPTFSADLRQLQADLSGLGGFGSERYPRRLLQRLKQITESKPAPDFAIRNLKGDTVRLSDYRGKVVYLDFWATNCAPCVAEIPDAVALQQKFEGKDVVFLYVSLGDRVETLTGFLARKNFRGTHLVDPLGFASEVAAAYKISAIPKCVLIDKKGVLVNANAPRPSNRPEQQIQELLSH